MTLGSEIMADWALLFRSNAVIWHIFVKTSIMTKLKETGVEDPEIILAVPAHG
jgi:hypothetical protein